MISLKLRLCGKQALYVPSAGDARAGSPVFLKQICSVICKGCTTYSNCHRVLQYQSQRDCRRLTQESILLMVSRRSTCQRAAHFSKTSESAENGLRKWRSQCSRWAAYLVAHRLELLEPSPDEETRSGLRHLIVKGYSHRPIGTHRSP